MAKNNALIKMNLTKITLNESKMKQIALLAQSNEVQEELYNQAQIMLTNAKPKFAYSHIRTTGKHFRDSYYITKPQKASFKINGERYPSSKLTIRPKGRYQVYWGVMTAGVMNQKPINYSNASAEKYPLESQLPTVKNNIRKHVTNLIATNITKIDNK